MSRPFEGRKRIVAYVLAPTETKIKKTVDDAKKNKGPLNTPGKVIDAQFAKKKPK